MNSPSIIKNALWRQIAQSVTMLTKLVQAYQLKQIISGYSSARAALTFVRLNIADYLKDEAKSSQALALEINADPNSLDLLLRLVVKTGIIRRDRQGNYQLTAVGKRLQSNDSDSLYGSIRSFADLVAPAWHNLDYTVKTGKSAFEETFGEHFYEHVKKHPDANKIFSQWMKESVREAIAPILNICDLSQVKTIVDVGGSTGELVALLLRQYPHLKAIVFDQPYLANDARELLKSSGVSDRTQFVGGDFFDSVASGGDLYILCRVLDNWNDDLAVKILKNCHSAMFANAKLLIIDSVHPDGNKNDLMLIASCLQIVVMGAGIARTKSNYSNLLQQAGFEIVGFAKTVGFVSFIEAVPR